MPQLPFQVAPKRETRLVSAVINGDTCSIEFPVFGSLLAGEEIQIRDSDYQAAVYRESSRLADALLAEGINESEAQRLAIRCLSTRLGVPVALNAAEQRILLRHADLVAAIQTSLAVEYAQQVRRTVTAVIAHRLNGCRNWCEEDTDMQIPQPLREAIAAFADSERNAGRPQRSPEELVEEMAETLGKLGPMAADSPSPPTGELSTGVVESSGLTLQNSTQIDSPASPSRTSSKRSKKVSAAV